MAQTLVTGAFLYLTAKLSPGGTSFVGDRDLGITKGRLKMRDPNNPDSTYTEWIQFSTVTAVGDGTFTYGGLTRSLSQVLNPATSTGSGKTWVAGTEAKLVAMHDQLADMLNGAIVPVYANATARDAAITSPVNGMSCYNTADGLFNDYAAGAWVQRANGATPNASTTVAGKVEIATQTEVDNATDTGGTGATVSVIPSTFQQGITNKIADQTTAEAGVDNTKLMTPLRTSQEIDKFISKFGDGSDGSVTISVGTTTLSRDMYYEDLTITSPGVLNPNGYRIFVRGTLSGNGKIQRNGNAGQDGSYGSTPSASGGSALNQGTLHADLGGGGSGTGGGMNGTSANPSYTVIGGVSGGTASSYYTVRAPGSGGTSTRGANYATYLTEKQVFTYLFNPATTSPYSATQYLGASSSGGGGSDWTPDAGSCGGGAGGNGGLIWICARTVNFTGTFEAIGGAGGAGGSHAYARAGGGGGGQGGIVVLIVKTATATGTKILTGGNGGAGAGTSSAGTGTNGSNGNNGVYIEIAA